MSTRTVPLARVCLANVLPAGADPITPFHQRIAAELALRDLERALRRLARQLDSTIGRQAVVPRRSRRSAWWPSD